MINYFWNYFKRHCFGSVLEVAINYMPAVWDESIIIIIIIINEYYLGAVKSQELLEHLTRLT